MPSRVCLPCSAGRTGNSGTQPGRSTRLKRAVLAAFLILAACRGPIRGEFGFSPVDRRDSGVLEKSVVLETEFRLGRANLFFHDYETIFWIYRMEAGPIVG